MRKFTALLLAALVLVGANIALADKTITLDKDTSWCRRLDGSGRYQVQEDTVVSSMMTVR